MLNRAKLICTSLHNAFGVPRQNVFTSIYHYRNREPAPGARYMEKLVNLSAAPGAA
jgi:hypothetical protein